MKKILLIIGLLLGCQQIKPDPSTRIGPTDSVKQGLIPQITAEPSNPVGQCKWQVRFSPNGGAEQQVVNTINGTNDSFYMLSYSFTSDIIAQALINKSKTKHVEVILDPSNKNGKGSDLKMLLGSKVIVYLDEKHAIAHNKVGISDARRVLTGSFNFTKAAERSNSENSLLLDCPDLAKTYLENYNLHKSHSKRIN